MVFVAAYEVGGFLVEGVGCLQGVAALRAFRLQAHAVHDQPAAGEEDVGDRRALEAAA